MILNMINNAELRQAVPPTVAGAVDINGAGIDRASYESVMFSVHFGTIAAGAVTGLKLQHSDDDGSADAYADVANSAVSVPDTGDDQYAVLDATKPLKRWVRLVVTRATQNSTVNLGTALLYGPGKKKTTQSQVSAYRVVVGEESGTA